MFNRQETNVEQMIMDALLNDYGILNRELSNLREDQLFKLIEREIETRKRKSFVERIHQRYAKLKTARERAEIMERLV
jgi:hypothetical protein